MNTVLSAIRGLASEFTLARIQHICPSVSVEMIRLVLKDLRKAGKIKCVKMGRNAVWKKTKTESR